VFDTNYGEKDLLEERREFRVPKCMGGIRNPHGYKEIKRYIKSREIQSII
jgi:flavin-dependent dehydrogenase